MIESRSLLDEKLVMMLEGKEVEVEVEVGVKKERMKGKKWLMNSCWTAVSFSMGMLLTLYLVKGSSLPSPSTPSLQKRQTSNTYTGKTIIASGDDLSVSSPYWRCVPPPPTFLLEDARVMQHPDVQQALVDIKSTLTADTLSSKDAISISIVHSSKGKIFEFHHGRKRLNESSTASPAKVNGNSIHRIASVSKVFAVLEALVLSRQAQRRRFIPEITLESRLQDVLPEFRLPREFREEAADITLGQLGSHRAGIGRDMGEMILNSTVDIIWPPVPGEETFYEKYYKHNTSRELLNTVSKNDLIWQVGQTPSYSNTGFSILGLAIGNYRKKLKI
ncbi:hypothetical protein TWF506_005930 [Arthrobotrys conoides]|uniref:Beta-lactamase-related domain-containing protein n=1 Tax=Arthrobotrys conoides TaxID=74498 RepID=A0AAN8NCX0_9PEZI